MPFLVTYQAVYRLYHLNGTGLKRRAVDGAALLRPDAPNLIWSLDFDMDALASERRIKCLACVDDFTTECLTITAAYGIAGHQVSRILDSIALFRGYPATSIKECCRVMFSETDQKNDIPELQLALFQTGIYRFNFTF